MNSQTKLDDSELSIHFKNVTKWRSYTLDHPVLDQLNWKLEGAGVHALLGPNGAGKSTTLQILLGLMIPDQGEISVLNFDPLSARQYLSAKLGYVPDSPPLYPMLTVEEYLKYTFELRINENELGKTQFQKKWASQLAKVCDVLQLGPWLKSKCAILSYGMKGRVALAQGFIHDPLIVIMDEPTKGLDPESLVMVRKFFVEEKQSKILLYCTHHLRDLPLMSDSVSILAKGKIIYQSKMNAVEKGIDFETLYIDTVKNYENTLHS
ncbi:MAG: ABC transporter ATP-binding protein [Bacteriovoracaceae bacterium]|nr:ABC transporter ATP-binding protein [Bacteriovoracaceae bacterium]